MGAIAQQSKVQFFNADFIHAVQIVHPVLMEPTKTMDEIKAVLSAYYKREIDETTVSQWKSCTPLIQQYAILTFSDNPLEPGSSKHGLWGIGRRYSWLKMKQEPDLESLRQALLMPHVRVRNDFDNEKVPYELPATWISGLTVKKTTVTTEDFHVSFNPQLTTIIGGRGSGKSSIIQFIRAVFNMVNDLKELKSIREEFESFIKRTDKTGGVLTNESQISIELWHNGQLYRITASKIKDAASKTVEINRYDDLSSTWKVVDETNLKLFDFDIYNQKQIYEIARLPNTLRNRIDNANQHVLSLREKLQTKEKAYLALCAKIREFQNKIQSLDALNARIEELETLIARYNSSGVQSLLQQLKQYTNETNYINDFIERSHSHKKRMDDYMASFHIEPFPFDNINDDDREEIQAIITTHNDSVAQISQKFWEAQKQFVESVSGLESNVEQSQWMKNKTSVQERVAAKQVELSTDGIQDVENFQTLLNQLNEKQVQVRSLEVTQEQLVQLKDDKRKLVEEMHGIRKEITTARKAFLKDILSGQDIKIEVQPYRDKASFEKSFREIVSRESGFESNVDKMLEKLFNGNVSKTILEIREDFFALRSDRMVEGYDGYFKNLIRNLADEQYDRLGILIPEDEISVSYKQIDTGTYCSIQNASAGQKTSSILTFLLSYGKNPLLLDQPEDDLDNHLVYGLIVTGLRSTKERRQAIVITHNANIPVNGDAEYVVAMNSSSKAVSVLHKGTLEEDMIKREICDVMEGGVSAFKLRSQRYNIENNKQS